jgi:hypothetical protein
MIKVALNFQIMARQTTLQAYERRWPMKTECYENLNLVVDHAKKQRAEKINGLLIRLVNRSRKIFSLSASRERILKHISAHSFD